MIDLKEFECKWGNWDSNAANSYDEEVNIKKEKFFSEDNGYTETDIESIKTLKRGETHACEYGNHTIKRLV